MQKLPLYRGDFRECKSVRHNRCADPHSRLFANGFTHPRGFILKNRFFKVEDLAIPSETSHEMLRALKDKAPAEMRQAE